jgi:hypothetical protein
MEFRRPTPYLNGVILGIAMILVGAGFDISLILLMAYSGSYSIFSLILGFPTIIFIMGWIIFFSNLSKHVRPFGYCPFCQRQLAWDNAYKRYFCHHCKKRWEAKQLEMGMEIN